MVLDVICDVDNCVFNEGEKCFAEEIKVGNNNCDKAKVVRNTQCVTFKSK